MPDNSTTALAATTEVLEELLRQLVDARFVLTDRDGGVTRWSRPAEELFGWLGARMLGRPLTETLGLDGELPADGGVLQTTVRCRNGGELELRLTLVPVGMSQSLEFNGFLEALEIAAPRGNALQQLQQSHRPVVDWIQAALRGEARLEDDDLAAGTIVAFRPLVEPPPPADEAEQEEQPSLASLDQARARLEEIGIRVEELARLVDEQYDLLRPELEATRSDLAALRSERADEQRALVETAAEAAAAEAVKAVERLAVRAEQAAEAARSHSSRAYDASGSAEAGARRVEELAAAAEDGAAASREAALDAEQAASTATQAADQAGAHRNGHRDGPLPLARLNAAATVTNAPTQGDGRRPLFTKPDRGPARAPRPGFDDVPQPLAVIETDGHFTELNPAFSDLVGYSEADFGAAVWPPVMDRANLDKHRDQMRAMLAGELDSAEVKTGYVHAQGLLVPVVGRISLVLEDGEPSHFLLAADRT